MNRLIIPILMVFLFCLNTYAMSNPLYNDGVISGSAVDTVISDSAASTHIQGAVQRVPILYINESSSICRFLNFYPQNSPIEGLELPERDYVQIGERHFIECNIKWDSLDSVDTSVLGKTALRGEIIAPNGYEFDGGLEPVIDIPVFIYAENMKPLENAEVVQERSFSNFNSTGLLMPTGGNPMEYINTADNYLFMTDSGDYFYCGVNWEDFPIPNTSGKITVTGKYNLPWGIKTNTKYRWQTLYAMDTDDIYLDYILNDSFFVGCQWLKYIEDYENIKMLYSQNGSEWLDGSELGEVGGDNFFIYKYLLQGNSSYSFRLEYKGKIYGDLIVDTTDSNLSTYYLNGDNDGGDNKPQSLPNYVSSDEGSNHSKGSKNHKSAKKQIKETTTEVTTETLLETKNQPNGTAVEDLPVEEITPNKTTIKGDRLIEAVKTQGDFITFEKDGVALELPTDFVQKNDIQPNTGVTVEIEKDRGNISLNVEVNNEPVDDIDGSKLRLKDKTDEIVKDDNIIKDKSDNDSYSEFDIDEPGTYTAEVNNEEKQVNYKIFIITGIIILLLGTVFIKWLSTAK